MTPIALAEEAAKVKQIMEKVKANEALLAVCDSHLFEFIKDSRPWDSQYRCQHCGGTVTGRELHWYMVGRAHGDKFGDEQQALLDAYAQRVTDQDAEIAILRQRELERHEA